MPEIDQTAKFQRARHIEVGSVKTAIFNQHLTISEVVQDRDTVTVER